MRRKRLKIARTWSTLLLEQAETRGGSSLHELEGFEGVPLQV